MKLPRFIAFALCTALSQCAPLLAITPTQNLQIDANGNLQQSPLKLPSGSSLTVEPGATLGLPGNATLPAGVLEDIAPGAVVNFDATDLKLAEGASLNSGVWADRVTGFSFTVGATKPTFLSGASNGVPAVDLAGNPIQVTSTVFNNQSFSSGFTYFLVCKVISGTSSSTQFLCLGTASPAIGTSSTGASCAMAAWTVSSATVTNPMLLCWAYQASDSPQYLTTRSTAGKNRVSDREMVMAYKFDPAAGITSLWVDGICVASQTTSDTTLSLNGGIALGALNNSLVGSFHMQASKLLVYPTALADPDMTRTSNTLVSRFVRDTRPRVWFLGDSIYEGLAASTNGTLADLVQTAMPEVRVINAARNGQSLAVQTGGAMPYPQMYCKVRPGDVCILGPGSIDIANLNSVATIESEHTGLVTTLHTQGAIVVQPEMIPKISAVTQATSDTNRASYNTWIDALTSGADYSVPLTSIAAFNASSSTSSSGGANSATYYATFTLPATGLASSGTVTLSGAIAGQAVYEVFDNTTSTNVSSDFATSITTANQLAQTGGSHSGDSLTVSLADGSHPSTAGYTAQVSTWTPILRQALGLAGQGGTVTSVSGGSTGLTVTNPTTTPTLTGTVAVLSGGTGTTTSTGTGSTVLSNSPTLVTPTLGAATATSLNGVTITASTGILTITNGKTLAASNSITFVGTDGTSMTFPATSGAVQTTNGTLALGSFGSITGTVPVANGGTGQTSAQASINALAASSGSLVTGDTFVYNGTNFARLPVGYQGQHLDVGGAITPTWLFPNAHQVGMSGITSSPSGSTGGVGTNDGFANVYFNVSPAANGDRQQYSAYLFGPAHGTTTAFFGQPFNLIWDGEMAAIDTGLGISYLIAICDGGANGASISAPGMAVKITDNNTLQLQIYVGGTLYTQNVTVTGFLPTGSTSGHQRIILAWDGSANLRLFTAFCAYNGVLPAPTYQGVLTQASAITSTTPMSGNAVRWGVFSTGSNTWTTQPYLGTNSFIFQYP